LRNRQRSLTESGASERLTLLTAVFGRTSTSFASRSSQLVDAAIPWLADLRFGDLASEFSSVSTDNLEVRLFLLARSSSLVTALKVDRRSSQLRALAASVPRDVCKYSNNCSSIMSMAFSWYRSTRPRLHSSLTHSESRSVLVCLSTLLLRPTNRLRNDSTREMRRLRTTVPGTVCCWGWGDLLGDQCRRRPGVTASSSEESLRLSCSHLRPTFLPHVASPATIMCFYMYLLVH